MKRQSKASTAKRMQQRLRLIDVFTKEHKKDIAAAKEELNQNRQNQT